MMSMMMSPSMMSMPSGSVMIAPSTTTTSSFYTLMSEDEDEYEDEVAYFSYAGDFYDFLDTLFGLDTVSSSPRSSSTSSSSSAKKKKASRSSSYTASEVAPSYPCQFEIEALCSRYSTRSGLESCLLN